MLNKRIINTGGGGAACTTDTTQILSADKTESLALYRFEDNVNDTSNSTGKFGKGAAFNGTKYFYSKPFNVINENILSTLKLVKYYRGKKNI